MASYIKTGGLSWYGAWAVASTATAALVANVLRASPLIVTTGYIIDRIQIEITTLGAGNLVLGIYDTKTDGTLYPNNLIVQGTQQDTSVGTLKTDTISATLKPNTLYWTVYNTSGVASTRSYNLTSVPPILGYDGGAGANRIQSSWSVASAYNATMPSTFVAGGTMLINTAPPIIQVRAQ